MNRKELEQLPSFATDPEAALASYRQLGFHIEYNVWTASECAALIKAAEKFPSFKDQTFAPAMQPHREEPIFLSALSKPTIVTIMEQLVEGRVSGLQTQFFFCPPGTPGFSMHQDNFYVEAKRDAFASAWTPLQDVSPEKGSLIVYPGSHRESILPIEPIEQAQSISQDINANRQQVVLPSGYEPVDLFVPMGATVFLHGYTVHASHQNRTNQFRNVLLMTYIRSGESFRPGFSARRAEVEVYS